MSGDFHSCRCLSCTPREPDGTGTWCQKPPAESPLQPRLGTTASGVRPAVDCAGPGAALQLAEFRPAVAAGWGELGSHCTHGPGTQAGEPGVTRTALCQVTSGSESIEQDHGEVAGLCVSPARGLSARRRGAVQRPTWRGRVGINSPVRWKSLGKDRTPSAARFCGWARDGDLIR